MGAIESTSKTLPIPKCWEVQLSTYDRDELCKSLMEISALPIDTFMSVTAELPELQAEAWEFTTFFDSASAAVQMDTRLNKMVYVMVPKRTTEEEFWRLYFCHVHRILPFKEKSTDTTVEMEEYCAFELTKSLLEAGDDIAINAVIAWIESEPTFNALAWKELERVLHQDKEQCLRIGAGLRMAISRGVIPLAPSIEATMKINVTSMDVDDIVSAILKEVGPSYQQGCAILLQGLPGSGKTSVITRLKSTLPCAICWSDENLFRAVTLLALEHCEPETSRLNVETLTPDMLQDLLRCVKFGKFNGKYDIQINHGNCALLASEIEDGLLKETTIEQNLPIIEQLIRGEVIKFSANVVAVLLRNGMNVLMEGRAQALNYIPSAFRIELTVSNPLIIGARRVAQNLLTPLVEKLNTESEMQPEALVKLLKDQLEDMRPPELLSRELLENGGDEVVSAIIFTFERDAAFIELSRNECRSGEALDKGMRRAAELIRARLSHALPDDISSKDIIVTLQRELNKATAL